MTIISLLKNIKLGWKLAIMLTIPVLGLLFIAQNEIRQTFTASEEAAAVLKLVELSVKLRPVVHELQTERGMTSGYLSSNGKKYRSELMTQRAQVDSRVRVAKEILSIYSTQSFGPEFSASLARAASGFDSLAAWVSTLRE